MNEKTDNFSNELTEKEIFLIARFCYKNGINYLSDDQYDRLNASILKNYPDWDIPKHTYDDDPIPYEALEKAGLSHLEIEYADVNVKAEKMKKDLERYSQFLDEDMGKSIHATWDLSEAYQWFQAHTDIDLVFMPKADGINTRNLYLPSDGKMKYEFSCSRGRSAKPLNITPNMMKILPKEIDFPNVESFLVRGEAFLQPSKVAYINQKYNGTFVSPRTAGMSFLRVETYDPEDYQYLKMYVFRTPWGDTLTEGIDKAKELGFQTIPYKVEQYHSMSFEEFESYISAKLNKLKKFADSVDIVTDGMVVEVNSRKDYLSQSTENMYDDGNIALKMQEWDPDEYESTVRNIMILPVGQKYSCRADIVPIVTKSGKTLSTVNLFNPAIMIANHIKVGSKIRFKYKNETTIDLIRSD